MLMKVEWGRSRHPGFAPPVSSHGRRVRDAALLIVSIAIVLHLVWRLRVLRWAALLALGSQDLALARFRLSERVSAQD